MRRSSGRRAGGAPAARGAYVAARVAGAAGIAAVARRLAGSGARVTGVAGLCRPVSVAAWLVAGFGLGALVAPGAAAAAPVPAAFVQEDAARVARSGRVVAVEGPRRAVIDLGTDQGVAAMDPVEFVLDGGETARGRVLSVEAGRATVVLSGRAVELIEGTAVAVEVVGTDAGDGGVGDGGVDDGEGEGGDGEGGDGRTGRAGSEPGGVGALGGTGGPGATGASGAAGAAGSEVGGAGAPGAAAGPSGGQSSPPSAAGTQGPGARARPGADGSGVPQGAGGEPEVAGGSGPGAAPEAAQEDGRPPVRLAGRVLSVLGPRRFGIDRGAVDGVASGDRVRLLPIDGPPVDGRVESVSDRSAEVRLTGLASEPRPGMRIEVLVPAARRDAPAPTVAAPGPEAPTPPGAAAADGGDADRRTSAWSNPDDGWEEGMPLLAGIEAVRPLDRAPEWGGRLYAISDTTLTTEDGRSAQFHRLGLGLWGENFLGRGERLQLDAEWNREFQNLPDQNDERQNRLRVDRFSYLTGGTRFDDTRLEVGRFLHVGLPELGVIDGVEWIRRRENGDSYGASFGYLPEPNEEFESGEDLSVSAHYRWVADKSEVFAATVGAQKTWHNFEADRDLLVLRYDYLPLDGWSSTGSALVDYYSGSDDEADRSLGLTQAWLTARRDWGSRYGLDLRYRHFEFPTLLRDEFTLQNPDQFEPDVQNLLLQTQAALLADARRDRVSADAWARLVPMVELRAGVGGWVDEDDQGGDARVGFEISGERTGGSRVFAEAFGVDGRFTSVLGGRAGVGIQGRTQRLDLFYELANQDQRGFDDDNDDFLQHRARIAWSYDTPSGFSLSTYVDGVDFQTEAGITIGVFAQWIF